MKTATTLTTRKVGDILRAAGFVKSNIYSNRIGARVAGQGFIVEPLVELMRGLRVAGVFTVSYEPGTGSFFGTFEEREREGALADQKFEQMVDALKSAGLTVKRYPATDGALQAGLRWTVIVRN